MSAALLHAGVVGCARNAVQKHAASATMGERIKQESITGTVNDIGAKHVSLRESDGETARVRVEDQTKMDRVAVGDQLRTYVSDDSYASTIQRMAP